MNIKEFFVDYYECGICLEKLTHPKICPTCNKFICDKCFDLIFTKEENNCPFCFTPQNKGAWMSIKFFDQLPACIDKLYYHPLLLRLQEEHLRVLHLGKNTRKPQNFEAERLLGNKAIY